MVCIRWDDVGFIIVSVVGVVKLSGAWINRCEGWEYQESQAGGEYSRG